MFFRLEPRRAFLSDANEELVNFHRVVRDRPMELLEDVERHERTTEHYYAIRSQDPSTLSEVQRASRFLYLNKTCYNGLYRVNKKGEFNVPFGGEKSAKRIDKDNLLRASEALRKAEILCGDFPLALDAAMSGAFVYLDPPYYPISPTANFTRYTQEDFTEEDHLRLRDVFGQLDDRGCLVAMSNSDTPFIRDLYQGYDVKVVRAPRSISCKGHARDRVTELVIRNYQ